MLELKSFFLCIYQIYLVLLFSFYFPQVFSKCVFIKYIWYFAFDYHWWLIKEHIWMRLYCFFNYNWWFYFLIKIFVGNGEFFENIYLKESIKRYFGTYMPVYLLLRVIRQTSKMRPKPRRPKMFATTTATSQSVSNHSLNPSRKHWSGGRDPSGGGFPSSVNQYSFVSFRSNLEKEYEGH